MAVFFALLSWLIWSTFMMNGDAGVYLVFTFSCVAFAINFYSLITIKTVKLTFNSCIVSYYFLPFNQMFSLTDIKSISQQPKRLEFISHDSPIARYLYISRISKIIFTEKKSIRLTSIGQIDYEKLLDCFKRIKRGETKLRKQRSDISVYFEDTIDGIFWIILMLILTAVLAYEITLQYI